jgi:hypothetical protein
VSRGKWTVHATASIRANPHSVVAWFQDPDRIEELLSELAKQGHCSIENSSTEAVRIRDVRVLTPSGSSIHMRTETQLGPDGRPGTWSGDQFQLVGHAFTHVRRSNGSQETKTWDTTTTIAPIGDEIAEVVITQHQQFVDPRWFQWLLPPVTEQTLKRRRLRDLVRRCEAELRTFTE